VNYSFSKNEKLCSTKDIQTIFSKGEKFVSYPFFFAYTIQAQKEDVPVKVMISVSKKKFKKAVDRNRIKRICREVYRLNKQILLEKLEEITKGQLHLSINYVANAEIPFESLQKDFLKSINNLVNEIKRNLS